MCFAACSRASAHKSNELRAPFEPEAGAYAPGHQHPGEGSRNAKIHQFRP